MNNKKSRQRKENKFNSIRKISKKKSKVLDKRTKKRKIGDIGENLACTFLMKRGYVIVDRNYLKKYGEIDIVAKKEGEYHFIEVKTVSRNLEQRFVSNTQNAAVSRNTAVIRETNDEYRAEDNVHPWKLKRLARVIQTYIMDKRLFEVDWQIDIIVVYLDHVHKKAGIEVISNIVI